MKLIVHTERGVFKSRVDEDQLTKDQALALKKIIQQTASEGASFTIETENGFVVLGKDLLKTAAFVVELQ